MQWPARDAHPTLSLVGSVTRDGATYNYSYTNPQFRAWLSPAGGVGYQYSALTVTGPDGYSQVYNISANQALHLQYVTSSTDSLGRTTSYSYDAYNRVTQITHPQQNKTIIAYDDRGNVTSQTRRAITGSGLADITDTANFSIAGCSTVMCWRPSWTRDGLLRQTDYSYNAQGRVTERLDPADANGVRRRTSVIYTASPAGISRVSEVRVCADTGGSCGTNALARTQYSYWGDTNLVSLEQRIDGASGPTLATANTYDPAGRLLATDGALSGTGDTSHNRYNLAGQIAGTISPDPGNGNPRVAVRNSYDTAGRLLNVEHGSLSAWQAETVLPANWTGFTVHRSVETQYYQNRKIRTFVRDGSAGTVRSMTEYSYDTAGRVTCTAARMNPSVFAFTGTPDACVANTEGTDGSDRITRTVYDAAGQRVQLREGVGTADVAAEATWAYNGNGQITTVIDANGNRATIGYDGHRRQNRWTFPSTTRPGAYNDTTQATALATAGSVNAADFEQYTYDAAGNRLSHRKRDGSLLQYEYDNLNRLIRKIVPERPTGTQALTAAQTRDVYYGHDLRNAPLFARFDSTSGEGVTNTYDGFGRLVSATTNMGGTSRTLTYQLDNAGARTRLTHPDTIAFDYIRDGLGRPYWLGTPDWNGRLFQAYGADGLPYSRSGGNGFTTWVARDTLGRLNGLGHYVGSGTANVLWLYQHDPAGQIRSVTRDNDTYAWAGHYAVQRTYTTDGLNRYTAAGGTTFGYDANGNLTSDGANSFVYDIENRLVGRSGGVSLVYDPLGRLYQVASSTTDTRFLYDGDALVAEYNAAGTMTRRYVHWAGADVPIVSYAGAAISSPSYLHTDHQGSIVGVSDMAGAVQINRYDEYGIPAATNDGRFQYTGQIWLAELGMYHYRARVYSPTLGRFLQTDPVGYKGGVNLYGYAGNDPVNRVDPTGLIDVYVGGASDEWMSHLVQNYAAGTRSDGSRRNGFYVSFSNIEPAITAMREAYARGEPVNVIGHSLGGKAAIELVARAGVPVNFLMTVDPVGGSGVSGAIYSGVARRLTGYWLNVYADRSEGSGNGDFIAPFGRVFMGNTLIPDDIESITTQRSHGDFAEMMGDVRADERIAASNARHARQRRRSRGGGGRGGGGVCPDKRPELQCAASVEFVN